MYCDRDRRKNTVTYSAGNGGQNICEVSLKPLRCVDPVLPPLNAESARMRIITTWWRRGLVHSLAIGCDLITLGLSAGVRKTNMAVSLTIYHWLIRL